MTTLIYDGSFEGLLTAVFEIYERKLGAVKMRRGEWQEQALFEDVLQVTTNELKCNRVLKGLRGKMSTLGLHRLYCAHMAGMEGEDGAIVGFIRYAFDSPVNIEEDYSNRYIMRVSEIVRIVRREKHRMEAFVRFQRLSDGIFYAAIEPDINVLPLLIRHFKSRYADQKWVIYDIRRHYGIYYDLHDTQFIEFDFVNSKQATQVAGAYAGDEALYQGLWKNYFHSVNIKERKNTRLHLRHIPKRYWRHLTEKI